MDGQVDADERESKESYGNVTEYFLTKLKRADDEMNVTKAELREVMEEIKSKDSRIDTLKKKMRDLLTEESNKKMKKLESTKANLDALLKKANKVLNGLGLIWVGDSARRDPMACCTSTNENYKSLRRIPPLRKGIELIDQGHCQINKPKEPVVPFSGVGYRLGTGSEVYGYESSNPQLNTPHLETQPQSTPEKIVPIRRRWGQAKVTTNLKNIPVESVMDRLSSAQYQTDDKIDDQPKSKSYEELPMEFHRMTTNERRRALKQMSIQIQKNMNKYSY